MPEGILIEYKRDNYAINDAGKRELLKDVSSFANTHGGHLIIGMNEDAGVPSEISPLKIDDADKERQRMESLVRDGIERPKRAEKLACRRASWGFTARCGKRSRGLRRRAEPDASHSQRLSEPGSRIDEGARD